MILFPWKRTWHSPYSKWWISTSCDNFFPIANAPKLIFSTSISRLYQHFFFKMGNQYLSFIKLLPIMYPIPFLKIGSITFFCLTGHWHVRQGHFKTISINISISNRNETFLHKKEEFQKQNRFVWQLESWMWSFE